VIVDVPPSGPDVYVPADNDEGYDNDCVDNDGFVERLGACNLHTLEETSSEGREHLGHGRLEPQLPRSSA
jgi:hypothetical protein